MNYWQQGDKNASNSQITKIKKLVGN